MLYFAYGSNMWREQMRERCPDHECLGVAVLKDHALCFPRSSPIRLCGVAGIAASPGAEVWGVVYRLSERASPYWTSARVMTPRDPRRRTATTTRPSAW